MAAQVAALMATMATAMTPVIEGVVGYRAMLSSAGFTQAAAEAMCVEYHAAVMRAMMAGK